MTPAIFGLYLTTVHENGLGAGGGGQPLSVYFHDASATCPEMTSVDYYFWRTIDIRISMVYLWADRQTVLRVRMAATAVVLQLISIFFCCGRCIVKFDSEPEGFTLTSQISGACD